MTIGMTIDPGVPGPDAVPYMQYAMDPDCGITIKENFNWMDEINGA